MSATTGARCDKDALRETAEPVANGAGLWPLDGFVEGVDAPTYRYRSVPL